MSDEGSINLSVEGHVLRIELARPEKRNSLTPAMMAGLAAAFDRLQSDPTLRVGLLCAAGDHFTSGLVQEVVPSGQALVRASELAAQIASNAPLAVAATQASALQYLAEGEHAAFAALPTSERELASSADAMEGAAAMIQRRPPEFTGA